MTVPWMTSIQVHPGSFRPCLGQQQLYQYSQMIGVYMVDRPQGGSSFPKSFPIVIVSHVWLTLDLMHQPVLGLAAIFLWICLYSIWCYECLDLGPWTPQICAQFGIFIFWKMQQKIDDTRHTHIQAQRLDKLNMFVKKTGFPKLEPLRASPINRPV